MPIQLRRLLLLFGLFIVLFLVVRHFLVPDSFGDIGHYRANALDEIAAHQVKYVGKDACIECHDDMGTELAEGPHTPLQCEVCHGAGYQHIDEPDVYVLRKPVERADCAKCHEKNAARPETIVQQDVKNHNPEEKCIECHNPHQP